MLEDDGQCGTQVVSGSMERWTKVDKARSEARPFIGLEASLAHGRRSMLKVRWVKWAGGGQRSGPAWTTASNFYSPCTRVCITMGHDHCQIHRIRASRTRITRPRRATITREESFKAAAFPAQDGNLSWQITRGRTNCQDINERRKIFTRLALGQN